MFDLNPSTAADAYAAVKKETRNSTNERRTRTTHLHIHKRVIQSQLAGTWFDVRIVKGVAYYDERWNFLCEARTMLESWACSSGEGYL